MKKKQSIIASAVTTVGLAAMTVPGAAQVSQVSNVQGSTAIRPFHTYASDEAIADLRRRVQDTHWPDKEVVTDESQGIKLVTMQKLADYWASAYDWRKVEARLNALPQFITTIDGLDIHFIH